MVVNHWVSIYYFDVLVSPFLVVALTILKLCFRGIYMTDLNKLSEEVLLFSPVTVR